MGRSLPGRRYQVTMPVAPWFPTLVAAAVAWILTRDGASTASAPAPDAPLSALPRASREDRDYVTSQVAMLGWPKGEVDRAIMHESGWKPAAVNPNGKAVGLIQFMPSTLRGYGYDGDHTTFRRLSAREQLPWILRFFRPYRWQQPGDTYLAMAWPAALGKSDGYVIAEPGSKVWHANPSLRTSKTGPITAGSIRRRIL